MSGPEKISKERFFVLCGPQTVRVDVNGDNIKDMVDVQAETDLATLPAQFSLHGKDIFLCNQNDKCFSANDFNSVIFNGNVYKVGQKVSGDLSFINSNGTGIAESFFVTLGKPNNARAEDDRYVNDSATFYLHARVRMPDGSNNSILVEKRNAGPISVQCEIPKYE